MLWGYALLTIATLPQDAISLSAVVAWASMDSIDRTARVAFVLIALLKLVILFGMFLMHTRVRFKLQFFEFEQLGDEEHGTPALTSGSPTALSRGSPAYNQQSYTAGEGDVAAVGVPPAP